MAGSEAVIEIRQLFSLDEFKDVLYLQKTIWGFDDVELLPMRFLVVVSKVGGHVFGAYDGAEMVGFCFAIPGVKTGGRPYLHSHMLGVLPRLSQRGHWPASQTRPAGGGPLRAASPYRMDL